MKSFIVNLQLFSLIAFLSFSIPVKFIPHQQIPMIVSLLCMLFSFILLSFIKLYLYNGLQFEVV